MQPDEVVLLSIISLQYKSCPVVRIGPAFVLHHLEFLDGTGYPNGLRGNQISDIVRLTTIVDIHSALVEKRAYRKPFTHAKAFGMMEEMGDKLDQHLLQAFRPIAFGYG